ncbi:unnamed protein product [Paramecium pentaurelia]|uniref:Uncharacterized protein n=1 Tax=Paramecium pentaurelia TaxID=43138 RepID=A0A8S1V0H1_9CILI|nr:unnamed protein product [Paramecium pentaurelia]
MNCPHHEQNPINLVCLAPHNCQCSRKLCIECLNQHGVHVQYIVTNSQLQKRLINKLVEYELHEKQTVEKKKTQFTNLLSRTKGSLEKILEEQSESLEQIYCTIEIYNQSFHDLIHEGDNLAELPQTKLEQLVQILEGTSLEKWKQVKNSYLMKLQSVKKQWNKDRKDFIKKQKKIKKVFEALMKSINLQEEVFEEKKECYDLLASLNDIDVRIFNIIIEKARQAGISDILVFLSNEQNQQLLEELARERDINLGRNNINKIIDVIRNIKKHDFNQNNYSTEIHLNSKMNLTQKISQDQKIIQFLIFLVRLTGIDNQFIQCGSNSLNILVEMKVDLTLQFFQNVRIQNTSLIGGNFVRCNFNESEFENVDISGINLNGAKLLNCKWKNLRIQESLQLEGHSDQVVTVCFSPNGTTLASGSEDKSIRLWDVKTGQQKFKLDGHSHAVLSLCFSPDETTLASGSEDKSIRLWDVKTGQLKFKLDGHTHAVLSLCFSPDETTLASGSEDKSIRLWDVETGQQKFKLDGHNDSVQSVCFSSDGTKLASGSLDKSIRIWNVELGQVKAKLNGHKDSVLSVCFSPDDTALASGSCDKEIFLWDVKTGKRMKQFFGHTHFIQSICFSPNGTTLASGSVDKSIRLWDVKTGQQKAKFDSHSGTVYSVCFSPDGNTLASGSSDMSIRLWDIQTSNEILPSNNNHTGILGTDTFITILVISQNPKIQAQGAQVSNGEFTNNQGVDIRPLLE